MERKKNLICKFLALGFVLFSPSLFGQKSFRDFLFDESRAARLKVPQLADSFQEEGVVTEIKDFSRHDFSKIYRKATQKLKVKKWLAQELPPYFHLPRGRPKRSYYNSHLIWAVGPRGEKLTAFRPVDTSTGCHSGCSPVIFHLQVSPQGLSSAIWQEAKYPLSKIWHQPLNAKDLAQALNIAQELPLALRALDDPEWTTDDKTQFPAQTWTFLKGVVIEGAAYTSFRIYEAALKTLRFLQSEKVLDEIATKQSVLISRILNLSSVVEGRKEIKTLTQILKDPASLAEEKHLVFRLGPQIIRWMLESEDVSTSEIRKFFDLPAFGLERVEDYCSFLQDLLAHERGQKLLLSIARDPADWPLCESPAQKYFPFLAASLLGEKKRAADYAAKLDLSSIPDFLKKDSSTYSSFIKGVSLLDPTQSPLDLIADFQVRFPRSTSPLELSPENEKKRAALHSEKEREFKDELRALFQSSLESFPKIRAVSRGKSKVPTSLPLAHSSKLYVFVASWCPHCQQTLSSWAKEYPPSNPFWKNIQIVEVFRNGADSQIEELCAVTQLAPSICQQILSIKDDAQSTRFYQELSLLSVPRKVLVNAKGKITIFDWQFTEGPGKDISQELKYLMEIQSKK